MSKLRHILVEGADGTGKTTFIENLKKVLLYRNPDLGIDYIHNGVYPSATEAFAAYARQRKVADSRENVVTIMDRAHLSEFTYGTIFRKDPPDRLELLDIDTFLGESFLLIHCNPDYETAHKAWSSRPDQEYLKHLADHRGVYILFDYATHLITTMKRLEYDWERDSEDFFHSVAEVINR